MSTCWKFTYIKVHINKTNSVTTPVSFFARAPAASGLGMDEVNFSLQGPLR